MENINFCLCGLCCQIIFCSFAWSWSLLLFCVLFTWCVCLCACMRMCLCDMGMADGVVYMIMLCNDYCCHISTHMHLSCINLWWNSLFNWLLIWFTCRVICLGVLTCDVYSLRLLTMVICTYILFFVLRSNVDNACIVYFYICICLTQLNMSYLEKCYRNKRIMIMIVIFQVITKSEMIE